MRTEEIVFAELAELCTRAGYAYTLAALCVENTYFAYGDDLTPYDLRPMYMYNRLIPTELSVLVGLLSKSDLSLTRPTITVFQEQEQLTRSLLDEMHFLHDFKNKMQSFASDSIYTPKDLREPIFYAPDPASSFQLENFTDKRYQNDNAWLNLKMNFNIEEMLNVIKSIKNIQENKVILARQDTHNDKLRFEMLNCLKFSIKELSNELGYSDDMLRSILSCFVLDRHAISRTFDSFHGYNMHDSHPIIEMGNGIYACFLLQTLFIAAYTSPFFWMRNDETYKSTAEKNRGLFTETMSYSFLQRVFGEECVYRNIIFGSKKKMIAEADVMVIYGDNCIILQAKSKTLTKEAKQGDGYALANDFGRAVQQAFFQGAKCADAIRDPKVRINKTINAEVNRENLKTYILCVVSDPFPSLLLLTEQLIDNNVSMNGHNPIPLELFSLDELTELITIPVLFIKYLNWRIINKDRINANYERAILSFFLNWDKRDEFEHISIDDSCSISLDIAMLSRRLGLPGKQVPNGILDIIYNKSIGKIIVQLSNIASPVSIDICLQILDMHYKELIDLNRKIDEVEMDVAQSGRMNGFFVNSRYTNMTLGIIMAFHMSDEVRIFIRDKLLDTTPNLGYLCISPGTLSIFKYHLKC